MNPTIGLLNPPYSGKDNLKNPTKKEIQFFHRMSNIASKFTLMIAPLSSFMQDPEIRREILKTNKLEAVLSMPAQIFEPAASAHTAIAILRNGVPHNNSDVYMYKLFDDGFRKIKNKGRRDPLNTWASIKSEILRSYKEKLEIPGISKIVKINSDLNEEWVPHAFITPNPDNFNVEKEMKEITDAKKITELRNDYFEEDITEIDFIKTVSRLI